jgi:hypothetical protein
MKLEFRIAEIRNLPDGSKEIILDIKPEYQIFVGYLLEGLDGWCYHTIIDTPEQLTPGMQTADRAKLPAKMMKVTVPPGFFPEVSGFLNDLQGYDI